MKKKYWTLAALFIAVALNVVNAQTKKDSKNITQSNQSAHIILNHFLNKNFSYNLIDSEIVTDTIKQEVEKHPQEKHHLKMRIYGII